MEGGWRGVEGVVKQLESYCQPGANEKHGSDGIRVALLRDWRRALLRESLRREKSCRTWDAKT